MQTWPRPSSFHSKTVAMNQAQRYKIPWFTKSRYIQTVSLTSVTS